MTAPIEPTNPSNLFSPFLPATFNIPEEEDRFRVFLNDKLSAISDVVNDKTIGLYIQQTESFNGEKFFYITTTDIRNGYTVIAYIPSYPNTGTLVLTGSSTPMFPLTNINSQFVITDLYGTASLPPTAVGAGNGNFIKFNNQGDSRISFTMTDTTITITTTTNLSAYSGFIVIKYLRDGF